MTLREHLQSIYDEHGRLTPQLVLETARPESHPLHTSVFNLAPEDAAEAYYLGRAQELITRVKIVYRQTPRGRREVRKWHAVHDERGYRYETAETIAADPMLATLVLQEMEREWRQLKTRYGHMREFVEMVQTSLSQDEAA